MINIIVCMFVADVVMIFVAFASAIILALYRLATKQYAKLDEPDAVPSGLRIKSKIDKEIFEVYDTRLEDGKVYFMVYMDDEFQWVKSSEYEPASK